MGYSASEIIPRFVQYAGKDEHGTEPDGKKGRARQRFPSGSGSSLFYETRGWRDRTVLQLNSYGSHFPLARLLLTPSGRRRLWILNGDSYGDRGFARTGTHQEMTREAVQQSGTKWIILPFSALREAGIDVDTIVPVQVLPERWTWEDRSAASLDDVPVHQRHQRVLRNAEGTVIRPPLADDGTEASPDYEGNGWHVYRRSALNGHQAFAVKGPEHDGHLHMEYEDIERGPDGLYHWREQRHWLGESVFRASCTRWDRDSRQDVTHRNVYFLSAFDEQEPRPMYFLAEMPRGSRPQTVAGAREALKPAEVLAAEELSIPVQRQGDVFAIRMPGLRTRDVPGPSRIRARVLGVNHEATEVREANGRTFARGKLYHSRSPREHVTIQLGDGRTWHELVRNTVPWSGTTPRAWSYGGRVD